MEEEFSIGKRAVERRPSLNLKPKLLLHISA
jgi:hypothetical protein